MAKRPDQQNEEESRRILERLAQEGDATTPLGRAAQRAESHLRADDADQADAVEVWGTRIGRGIAGLITLVAIVLFVGWLRS